MRTGEVRNAYTILVGIPYIKKVSHRETWACVAEQYGNKFRTTGRWKGCEVMDWLTDWYRTVRGVMNFRVS